MPGTRFYRLDEGQIAVRLDRDHLPDLDALMLDLAQWLDDETGGWQWEDNDNPTRIPGDREPAWQWAKISPCWCGEHGWHWDARSAVAWPKRHLDAGLVTGEPDMIADRPKGRFIAMEWA